MPTVPSSKKCNFFGCKADKVFGTYSCADHGAKRSNNYQENAKLYNTAAWKKKRIAMKSKYPLCACCLLEGRVVPTEHIDHVIPHKRLRERFLVNIFQGLCAACHTQKTTLERKGIYRHYTENGAVDYNDDDANMVINQQFNSENFLG